MPMLIPCPKCQSTDVWSNSMSGGIRTECDGCGYHGPIRDTAQQSQDAWLAQAHQETEETLRQQNIALRERVARLQGFIKTAPVNSGVCCCGADMAQHPHDNHSPVDQ